MFNLISLPYAPEALAPVISAETLRFHHGKHLQGYVNNLNALLPGSPFEGLELEEIVRKAVGTAPAVFNNAGQILNHNLYFTQFRAPSADAAPQAALSAQIEGQFGSFEAFQTEFVAKGVGLFGSWRWDAGDYPGSRGGQSCHEGLAAAPHFRCVGACVLS